MRVFHTWINCCRQLVVRFKKIPSQARAVGMLTHMLKPNFDNNNNFEDSLANWEDEMHTYENEPNSSLSDDIKLAVMLSATRGALQ